MKKIVNNWHWISAYLAGGAALVAILVPMESFRILQARSQAAASDTLSRTAGRTA